jgi:O-succinylbenzoate synthase
MKIASLKAFQFSIPLKTPLKMKNRIQKWREGVIVQLEDADGHSGIAEASPFPGLHNETIKDVIKELIRIGQNPGQIDLEGEKSISKLPSLQLALEWAWLSLTASQTHTTSALLLNPNSAQKIEIHALLSGDQDEIFRKAQTLKSEQWPTVKVKTGAQPLEDDIYQVLKLNELFEGNVKLRLDANRKWSANQAETFCRGTIEANIEYIEEPVSNVADLPVLFKSCGIPFALDETLTESSLEMIKDLDGLSAFIIKPFVIGSIDAIKNWSDLAEKINAQAVFSSTFESGVGLWATTNLAAALGSKNTPHGLDTFSWLEHDIISPAFSASHNQIDLSRNMDWDLQTVHLNEIDL